MFEKSPFESLSDPKFLEPFNDVVYAPATYLSVELDKEMDQAVYFIASFFAIACSFYLRSIKDETTKKMFSMVTGFLTSFYVFGVAAFASVFQNLLCFALMKLCPQQM